MAILISTPQDLNNIRNDLTVDYELVNDIDMTGYDWTPIGYYDNVTWIGGFQGNFNGKGYVIKNLTIKKSAGIYLGLFGQAFYGTIQNVGLENVTINGSQCRFVGALIGYGYSATIKNCYVKGGNITAQDESGGLLGKVDTCTIENSYSSIPINLNTDYYGGGFVGSVDSNTTVKNSFSTGNVYYTKSSSWSGKSGFAGFIRDNAGITFENCFWDKETSGQSISPVSGLTGKTTAEMKQQSTYIGWDFTNTWRITGDYLTLLIFGASVVSKKETITVTSFINPIHSNMSKSSKSTKQLNTYANAILGVSERHTRVIKSVEGYLSQIHSDVSKSSRTVRSTTQQVQSYISPIYSSVHRESKTIKHLLATVNSLEGGVGVYIPMNTKGAYAYVSFVQNASMASYKENISNVSHIENPSNVEVI
ncbi:hypothetical protein [Peribacillus asahii]|uniref:hypothetical protein n=1 Tax=Peribacillus asahii TaxID=228899 RepID=UPI00207A768B|nr:hypothetical protein [Peribacillus asahii]USK86161.1 hypothetical protein LIT35_05835 [Peribacillus asahii]